MIKLGQSKDGRLVIGSSEEFPADIKHVEYYKDQRLFSLVFEGDDEDSALMPCEISKDVDGIIRKSPNILVIAVGQKGIEPYGYTVPLIQIGV